MSAKEKYRSVRRVQVCLRPADESVKYFRYLRIFQVQREVSFVAIRELPRVVLFQGRIPGSQI